MKVFTYPVIERDFEPYPFDLHFVNDMTPSWWVQEKLTGFAGPAINLVPADFEAYARIFHPVYANRHDANTPYSWAQIAHANGKAIHPYMQWDCLLGDDSDLCVMPGLERTAPNEGKLDIFIAKKLAIILRSHTKTPNNCWFGLWHGFGNGPSGSEQLKTFPLPAREYFLASGAIEGAAQSLLPSDKKSWVKTHPNFWCQTANLWWPEDKSFCVASEIDLVHTVVGGSQQAIDEIVASPFIEAAQIDKHKEICGAFGDEKNYPAFEKSLKQ